MRDMGGETQVYVAGTGVNSHLRLSGILVKAAGDKVSYFFSFHLYACVLTLLSGISSVDD